MSLTSAMILAAGLGTRMKPLTDVTPKPLVQVGGATLLDHTLAPLTEAGITRAVINVHHLADQIEAAARAYAGPLELIVSDERAEILDSGGGCAKALPLLSDPFLIRNADSFWTEGEVPNLVRLREAFDPARMDTLLLLCPSGQGVGFEGKGDFFLDASGRLTRRGEAASAPFVYAGAAIMSKAAFAGREPVPFSLNALWNTALANGRLYGLVLDGLWLHVGTVEGIALAEAALNKRL